MVHKLFRSVLAGLHQPALPAGFRSPAPSLVVCAHWPAAREPAQALDTGKVLGGPTELPESIPWAKLEDSSLPAKVNRECIVNALQWADLDKGAPQDLRFSLCTFCLSAVNVTSCLNDTTLPILEKVIPRCRKMRWQGDQCIPAETCWIQISLGDFLIWAMCPLTVWWHVS